MTPTLPTTRMTAAAFADFCDLPENADKTLELVRGEVVEVPSPTKIHGVVCVNIATRLHLFAASSGVGYVTTNDFGVILAKNPDTVRGPDVAFYTDAAAFADLHPKWGEDPPVLAVEVLSPADKMRAVMVKIHDYLSGGVAVVWLVNYDEMFVTVFRRDAIPQAVGPGGTLTVPELPGFAADVAAFFRMPGEKP